MSMKISCGGLVGSLILAALAHAGSGRERDSRSSPPAPPAPGATDKVPDLVLVEQLIVELTNEFRKQEGREPVRPNAKLSAAAREFAAFMARKDKLSHTADDKQPSERTAAQGYEDCIIAENIAYEFDSEGFTTTELAKALVEGWKKSPDHRKNMLDADVDEIGVGVAQSKETKRYYAVQDFGRPKSKEIVFTIKNEGDSKVDYSVDGTAFTLEPRYTVTQHRCRPPELTFRLPGDDAAKGDKNGERFRPRTGAHYVIRTSAAGRYSVTQE